MLARCAALAFLAIALHAADATIHDAGPGYRIVDLSHVANMAWKDERAGDRKGGWTDQGENDMRSVQPGRKVFHGVPCELLDPDKNDGKAVVVLNSPDHFKAGPESVTVPVAAKANVVCFLHAAAWCAGQVVTYVVQFADGTSEEIPINAGQDITDWWVWGWSQGLFNDHVCTAFVVPSAGSMGAKGGMFLFAWKNPKPDVAISAIELKSLKSAVIPIVAAITLADEFPKFPGPQKLSDDSWYPFASTVDNRPGAIGMQEWMDKPAGIHGPVTMDGDHFKFADGTPVKFWGVWSMMQDRQYCDINAARWEKYGVNIIRFHPLLGTGGDNWRFPHTIRNEIYGNTSLDFVPCALDRYDYLFAQLKKHGIYVAWSHNYYNGPRPGDRDKLWNYDEVVAAGAGGLINAAPDLQDLSIAALVKLLKHRNPYTGLTYAEDPALANIEVQNEDDIFFYMFNEVIKKCPTYKQRLFERFATWLKEKYATQEAVEKAWGRPLRVKNEKWGESVELMTDPNSYAEGILTKIADPMNRKRLVDRALFLHHEQNQYYGKFVKAVNDAGYKGSTSGSAWWATPGMPQMLNLRSDALTGLVDRHSYGGSDGTRLLKPGSDWMSVCMHQVANRPFGLTEWGDGIETGATMAAYGFGLQGWDYMVQCFSTTSSWSDFANTGPWNIPQGGGFHGDYPIIVGQYPVFARMAARGDVKQGEPVVIRRVSDEDIENGIFDFSESVSTHGWDNREFGGSVAPDAFAAGRVVMDFPKQKQPSTMPDPSSYRDGTRIKANNGQLVWETADRGYFTVNTDSTKGVYGFTRGKAQALAGATIEVEGPEGYASVSLSAAGRTETLATCRSALVVAMGNEANTGYTTAPVTNFVLEKGTQPVLMEGVTASISLAGRPILRVNVLNCDGIRQSGKEVEVHGGQFTIDTTRDKTPYYEVVFVDAPIAQAFEFDAIPGAKTDLKEHVLAAPTAKLTYAIVRKPEHGEVALNGSVVSFTAKPESTAIFDYFSFRVSDGVNSSEATVVMNLYDSCNRDFEWPFAGQINPTGDQREKLFCAEQIIIGAEAKGLYWTFEGDAGVRVSGGNAESPNTPSGKQMCFIRGKGALSGTLPVPKAGKQFKLSFIAEQRAENWFDQNCDHQELEVFIDGTSVGVITPDGRKADYNHYSTSAFTAQGKSVAIRIEGRDPMGKNYAAFIDCLRLESLAGDQPSVPTTTPK